jgi:protein gp37
VSGRSSIEWTTATWNFLIGCQRVSAGCAHCYATRVCWRLQHNPNKQIAKAFESVTKKQPDGRIVWTGRVNVVEDRLLLPLRWKKPMRIFVNSLSDLFHEDVSLDVIRRALGVMAECRQHTFQILTKRSKRLLQLSPHLHFPGNVWVGVSVEDHRVAQRIRDLQQVPATVRFLSLEPLLGPLQRLPLDGIHWVIAGGESGPNARPVSIDWIRSIRDQCANKNVPFFFKQWGGTRKNLTGRTLDGAFHDAMPSAAPL